MSAPHLTDKTRKRAMIAAVEASNGEFATLNATTLRRMVEAVALAVLIEDEELKFPFHPPECCCHPCVERLIRTHAPELLEGR
jgi:Zn finger protein HypA/HybF involved in hydrogenase expression